MKQYMMSVMLTDGEPMPQEGQTETVEEFNQKLVDAGSWVFGGGLHPPTTATVVRSRGGEVTTTDGPFAESKEYLAGFWVIKVPDLDAALALAARAAAACGAPVEVRPFDDESQE